MSDSLREITYRQALNEALAGELEARSMSFSWREVAEYNGAYKVSQGLPRTLWPKRIIDTPISKWICRPWGRCRHVGLRPIIES